jgi:hypothetical protein
MFLPLFLSILVSSPVNDINSGLTFSEPNVNTMFWSRKQLPSTIGLQLNCFPTLTDLIVQARLEYF